MLKKMVILAVVGFVAVAAISGTKIASHLKSEWRSAQKEAEDAVPPEKEIARLKNEVDLLDKDVKTLVAQLAKERVEVNQLDEKVLALESKQNKDREALNIRAEQLKKDEGQIATGQATNIAARKADLQADVKRFGTAQKSLEAHKGLLANRIKIRDSLEKQLIATKNQKSELAGAVEEMEAELALLKLQQVESKYQTDDTRLAKIKEDLRKLRTKVDIKREELKLSQTTLDESTGTTNSSKSVDDIMAPLNTPVKKPEGSKTDSKMPLAD